MPKKNLQRHDIVKKIISILLIIVMAYNLVNILINTKTYAAQTRNSDENNIYNIDENLYPGYATLLKALKASHPNWNFTLLYTDLDWIDVLTNETIADHTRSLVSGQTGEWLCTVPGCDGVPHDGTSWFGASQTAVAYYMDPRNFLTESKIFQFETLSYIPSLHTEAGVESILKGSFMSNVKISTYYNNSNYSQKTFAQVIMDAAKESGVSPYHIASRIRLEVGASGRSGSVTGTVSGYEGYFNFYNIGAYAGTDAVLNGLAYAKNEKRNWNSPEKAIIEGAKWISSGYISQGQDCIYLEKFDVDAQYLGLYSHQYQQNIQAAASESSSVYNTYLNIFNNDLSQTSFNFIIPMYKNMPKTISRYPSSSTYVAQDAKLVIPSNDWVLNAFIRKTPGGEAIGLYNPGTKFLRIELNAAKNVNGNNWDKIMLPDGTIGYIATKYAAEDTSVETLSKKGYTTTAVDLTNGPRTVANGTTAYRTLYEGQSVTILEEGKYNFDGTSWTRVRLGDGATGYVPSSYIKIGSYGEDVEITCPIGLNFRTSPNGTWMRTLDPGVIVERLEKATEKVAGYYWDKVRTSDGTIGYMARETYNPYVLWLTPVNNSSSSTTTPTLEEPTEKIEVDETENTVKAIPQANFETIKAEYPEATIVSGNENLGTGTKIKIGEKEYTIIKFGDLNGDGEVDIIDWALLKRHLIGTSYLKNEFKLAGILQPDKQEIDIIDWALLKRHLIKTQYISIPK